MWTPWLLLLAAAPALQLDLNHAVGEALSSETVTLSLSNVAPKKRVTHEILLSISDSLGETFIMLNLDRYNKTVSIDSSVEKVSFKIPVLKTNEIIKSFIFVFEQRKHYSHVSVYFNCEFVGKKELTTSLKSLFEGTKLNDIHVVREHNYDLDLDSNMRTEKILLKHNCQKSDQMMGLQPHMNEEVSHFPRGDIPIIHDCDDNLLVKTINELIAVVKKLQGELEMQQIETRNLRHLLEQCDICRPGN